MECGSPQPLTALVLAGQRPGGVDPVAKCEGVKHKALALINHHTMIEHVTRALTASPYVGQIVVCCDDPSLFTPYLPPEITFIKARPEGPSASVRDALARFGTPLLVTTSDNALLQSSWVDEFLSKTQTDDGDLFVGIALKQDILKKLPHTKRTYIKLKDITFSGCNLFLFKNGVSARIVDLWFEVEKLRKRPLRIALKLGLGVVIRALTGQLDRRTLLRRLYELTSAHVRFVALSDGRAAVDVDKPSDLQHVRELMHNIVK